MAFVILPDDDFLTNALKTSAPGAATGIFNEPKEDPYAKGGDKYDPLFRDDGSFNWPKLLWGADGGLRVEDFGYDKDALHKRFKGPSYDPDASELDNYTNAVKSNYDNLMDHGILDMLYIQGDQFFNPDKYEDPNWKYDFALDETKDNEAWGLSAIEGPEDTFYVPDSDMVTNPYYIDEHGVKQENKYYGQKNTREVQLFFENNKEKRLANIDKKDIAANKKEQRDWMFWEMRRTRLQDMANRLMDKAQSNQPFQYKLMGEENT